LAHCWFRRVELTRQRSVDERALRVDFIPAPLAESDPARCPSDLGATLARLGAARDPLQARQEQALLLDALVGAVALRSLIRLIEPGHSFTIGELSESGRIAPDSVGMIECLLRVLGRLAAAPGNS